MTALLLAPKWRRAANGGSRKFGSFQPQPTQRELDWSTWMFFESPFFWYPSCLVYAQVVWWSTALWTARTTRRRWPGKWLTLWCITSVEMFFNLDVICCGEGGWRNFFLVFQTCGTTFRSCVLRVDDTVDCKDNLMEETVGVGVLLSVLLLFQWARVVPETSGLPEISGNTRCFGLPATRWFLKLNRVGSGIERNTG